MKWKKPTCALLVATLILGIAMMVSVSADPLPKLFVDPPIYTATKLGEVFTIDVNIANSQDLAEFEFKLGYNTALLDVLDAVEGPFPPQPIATFLRINETEGYVLVYGNCWPANGNGTIATVTFNTTYAKPASCTLDLYNTTLKDSYQTPITHEVEDGKYEFIILGVATDKYFYKSGENVTIFGNATLPQNLMALEVNNPETAMVVRTLQLSPTIPPGDMTILDVVPCDEWGNPKTSFQRGTHAYFNVTLRNSGTKWKDVTITINAYDANMVPLPPVASLLNVTIGPGTWPTVFTGQIYIPDWASTGYATAYVSALTNLPLFGGVPYCPEKPATFRITAGTLGASALAQDQGNPTGIRGNYNLTFKLPPDSLTGVYRVHAVSTYNGQPAISSTVFGVNVIPVPDRYPTIQGAVNAATTKNNTILVAPGTYNEDVTINKALKLVGVEPTTTIINGSGTGTVLTVTASNVEIRRFTIKNSGSPPKSGITLNNSSGSTISENIITSNNGYGINIHSSNNIFITDNTLANNNYGIYLNHSTRITIRRNNINSNKYNFGVFGDSIPDFNHYISTSNTVNGKPIYYWVNRQNKRVPTNAGFVGIVNCINIDVRGLTIRKNGQGVLFAFTNNSFIERINAMGNEYGIYLVHSYSNIIVGSGMSNNTVGIYQRYCDENIICHNNIVNNTNQVDLYQSSNTWDDSAGRGNYWSDYTGVDDGSGNRTADDGVGDTLLPHQDVDWYPLMNPWTLVHDVAVTGVTPILPPGASHIYPGWVIKVKVTVKNEGDFTETSVLITVYYDGKPISMRILLTKMNPQTETAIEFTWDTTGVSPGTSGLNYTVKAVASGIFGENDTEDNTFTDGTVQVNLLGDVNSDGRVNVLDVILVLINAGPSPPKPPKCDINGDGRVNVLDVILIFINAR